MKTCPNIKIEFIPHETQRYPTVGDWYWSDASKSELIVRVSIMGDWRSEFAVAVHEAFEALACQSVGIEEEDVTAFDLEFEKEREAGVHDENAEPGSDPRAPYLMQHEKATVIESLVTEFTDLRWREHEENVYRLP